MRSKLGVKCLQSKSQDQQRKPKQSEAESRVEKQSIIATSRKSKAKQSKSKQLNAENPNAKLSHVFSLM